MNNSRIRISAAVLCILLLLTVYSVITVRRQCDALIVQTGRIMQAGSETAEITALQRHWKESARTLRWFVPNHTLTDLNEKIMRLDALGQNDSLPSELAAVSADLTWLRDSQLTVF